MEGIFMKIWDELYEMDSSVIQNELNTSQSFHTISECFHSLILQLKNQSLNIEGALFVCDTSGQLVDSYIFSSLDTKEEQELLKTQGMSWKESSIGPNAVHNSLSSLKYELVKKSDHTSSALKQFNSFAIPIFSKAEQLTTILGMVERGKKSNQDISFCLHSMALAFTAIFSMNVERTMNRKLTYHHQKAELESKQRDVLFQVAKNLHSKIDVDSVLSEVIHNIKMIYPLIEIDLFLSQDNNTTKLPVKPLSFEDNDAICTRAFMEGKVLFDFEPNGRSIIAAPLSGKQGVYGVFQLNFEHDALDDEDLKFISMLADSAGTAFENAKLYEQSNLLISELRLINEITRRLNQSLKLQDIFNFASKELLNIFNANYSCILKLDPKKDEMVVQASNLPSFSNEIFKVDYGFSGIVYKTKEPIIISDYFTNSKVDSKLMEVTQSRSLIASPILVGSEVVGVILVTHEKPNYFSYDNYKLLQILSGHIGLAITNASLHAEVRRMVITDNLTGLSTRSYLDEQVSLMQKRDFCGSLIMVDIDYFKKINDTFGHQVGDKILIQVSQIIMSSIRDTDIAARWGGEELAIYLPQSTIDQTMRVAERIRLRIDEETKPHVSVSCGIAQWHWEDEKISVESLFYQADMALYKAKNLGRNQIKIG